MKRAVTMLLALLATVWLGAAGRATGVNYTVTDLGTLGGSTSEAWGINNAGQIVGRSNLPGDVYYRAFRYEGGVMTDLGTINGCVGHSWAFDINEAGGVAGRSCNTLGYTRAFVWNGGPMVDLGTFGGSNSAARGINESGQVAGNAALSGDGTDHAFLYSGGPLQDLGVLVENQGSVATDVNDVGQVVGYAEATPPPGRIPHAFLYSDGQMTDLTPGTACCSYAWGINNAGKVVGQAFDYAFVYSDGVLTQFGTQSAAMSINSQDQIVGYFALGYNYYHAFVYEDGAVVDLNDRIPDHPEWDLNFATSINDSGQIVGIGTVGGKTHAFLLTPMPTAADLVETSVSNPPDIVAPSASFDVTDTTRNQGGTAAASTTTRYYLSADPLKSPDDVRLSGKRVVPVLAPGTSSTGTTRVQVPEAMPTGTYRLLACADDTRLVDEADETNNCRASSETVLVALADLVTLYVQADWPQYVPGAAMGVIDSVRNDGNGPAGASTTRYYLSIDTAKNAGDVRLTGKRNVIALEPGASSSGSATTTIPVTMPPGSYHILACADDLKVVIETNETNNCIASTDTVLIGLPDLATISVDPPPVSAAPGATFVASDTIENLGNVPAPPSRTRYYVSLDTSKGADDLRLTGSSARVGLAPGESVAGSAMVAIPTTTPNGTYYLLACADDQQKIAEADESNNCLASPTTMLVGRPDLITTFVSDPPAEKVVGEKFSVTDIVGNQGSVTAGTSTTRYYLSVDTSKGAGDIRLTGARAVASLPPGGSSNGSRMVTVPLGTAPGTYRLLACADDLAVVAESDETNNCRASTATILINADVSLTR